MAPSDVPISPLEGFSAILRIAPPLGWTCFGGPVAQIGDLRDGAAADDATPGFTTPGFSTPDSAAVAALLLAIVLPEGLPPVAAGRPHAPAPFEASCRAGAERSRPAGLVPGILLGAMGFPALGIPMAAPAPFSPLSCSAGPIRVGFDGAPCFLPGGNVLALLAFRAGFVILPCSLHAATRDGSR
jgi:hypothetical protein